jgi:hypothetical protein
MKGADSLPIYGQQRGSGGRLDLLEFAVACSVENDGSRTLRPRTPGRSMLDTRLPNEPLRTLTMTTGEPDGPP